MSSRQAFHVVAYSQEYGKFFPTDKPARTATACIPD